MRLIDADGLVTKILEEHKKAEDTYDLCVDEVKDILCGIVSLIDEQPTAYDPDKVVEQLEERTAFLKDCTKYGNKTAEQQAKSYDTMMMYEVKDLVDDLLEIVKAGGADAEH